MLDCLRLSHKFAQRRTHTAHSHNTLTTNNTQNHLKHAQKHPKAGQWNFDLSYFAFEKLAHPMYGIMMVDFRCV